MESTKNKQQCLSPQNESIRAGMYGKFAMRLKKEKKLSKENIQVVTVGRTMNERKLAGVSHVKKGPGAIGRKSERKRKRSKKEERYRGNNVRERTKKYQEGVRENIRLYMR